MTTLQHNYATVSQQVRQAAQDAGRAAECTTDCGQ